MVQRGWAGLDPNTPIFVAYTNPQLKMFNVHPLNSGGRPRQFHPNKRGCKEYVL